MCRKQRPKYGLFLLLFTLILMIQKCSIDHGLKPIHSRISGRVLFRGEAPAATDQVRVGAAASFPPSQMNEILFSDPVDFRRDSAEYELYLPPGDYEVVAVIWKEHNQPWNISDIIGLYGGFFLDDVFIPSFLTVSLEDGDSQLDDIHIPADLNRVNRDARIRGSVTFSGTWPKNSGMVAVAAFSKRPAPGDFVDYYFSSLYIDYSIPPFSTEGFYQCRVRGNEPVAYIAVLWIDDGFHLDQIRDLGFYEDPMEPGKPGAVTPPAGGLLENIDIQISFGS